MVERDSKRTYLRKIEIVQATDIIIWIKIKSEIRKSVGTTNQLRTYRTGHRLRQIQLNSGQSPMMRQGTGIVAQP